MTRLRVCVAGVTGWTGSAVAAAMAAAPDLELAAGVARTAPSSEPVADEGRFSSLQDALERVPVDVVVDYTHPAAVKRHVELAIAHGAGVVVGTSGLSEDDYGEIDRWARERSVGVVAAGNFSVLAALLLRFSSEAARYAEQWEILDFAGATKPDAPSGTARELAERIRGAHPKRTGSQDLELPGARGANVAGAAVHSVRLPSFTLSTELILATAGERLSIRHDAGDHADIYVEGTLIAVRRVRQLKGLVRGLDAILD